MGRLSKITFLELSQEQYALGDYTEEISVELSKMVNDAAVRAVSIYTSCLDVLLQTDFDSIIADVTNPRGVPILPFRRGPMVKRMESPVENARTIGTELTGMNLPAATPASGAGQSWVLPPLASDFTGAVSIRARPAPERIVLTGGGCASCPRSQDDLMGLDFSYADIDDLDVSEGIEEAVADPSVAHAKDAGRRELAFLGTPVTDTTGIDGSVLRRVATTDGLEAHFQATDGFHDAVKGWSDAELDLLKRATPVLDDAPRSTVVLVGWSPFVFGRLERLHGAIEFLHRQGTELIVPGLACQEQLDAAAHANAVWIISGDGLPAANWLSSTYDVPVFRGLPVGTTGWNHWVSRLIEYGAVPDEFGPLQCPLIDSSLSGVRTTVVVPEHPALAKAVCTMLKQDLGCSVSAVPISELDQLRPDDGDVLIADPLILEQRICDINNKIALPYPLSSGNLFIDGPYEYIGEEGIKYFSQAISSRTK